MQTDRQRHTIDLSDHGDSAGREAEKPTDIPGRGWKAIIKRVKVGLKNNHTSLLAAGVAFKSLLALFPSIVAVVTIWGLVASPQEITRQVAGFTSALPRDAANLLERQMSQVASTSTRTLSIALAVSVLLALWSASGGMTGLMEACTAAYDEVDTRRFPVKRGIALLLTVGAVVFVLLSLALIAVLPAVLGSIGLASRAETIINIGKWVLLAVLVMAAVAVVFKYAPDRERALMRWVTPGAVIATVLWLIGSALFTVYVNNLGKFGETYGSFAGIVVLMLWLFLTAYVVLLGAQINAEIERQTATDTTVGNARSMGQRGARPADRTPEHFDSPRA
ncbi:MAG: YihY/virulence factor BrkB family protein [Chloroflexota bacterium]|nr:YihY/virulence factor BrkB family protein [Chloroflexota bacterium]